MGRPVTSNEKKGKVQFTISASDQYFAFNVYKLRDVEFHRFVARISAPCSQ